jgi:hypothetical protein
VIERVSASASCAIYRARDLDQQRAVALKVLKPALAGDPAKVARFVHAARCARAVGGAGAVEVLDVGMAGAVVFAALELVPGRSLEQELGDRKRLPPPEALRLVAAACRALGEAHRLGLVHRNINPSHVLLPGNGDARLLCSSLIARQSEADPRTMVLGEFGYIPPEQARAERATPASDIYSLGVVLYEALSGRRPFDRATSFEVIKAVLTEAPPPLDGAPAAAARVVARALSKAPGGRHGSADELARACEAAAAAIEAEAAQAARDGGMTDVARVDTLGGQLYALPPTAGGALNRRGEGFFDGLASALARLAPPGVEALAPELAALYLRDRDAVGDADLPQLARLVLAHLRDERVQPGHLQELVEKGHVHAIARRLISLRDGMVAQQLERARDPRARRLAEGLFAVSRPASPVLMEGYGAPVPGGWKLTHTGGPTEWRLDSGVVASTTGWLPEEQRAAACLTLRLGDGLEVVHNYAEDGPDLNLAHAAEAVAGLDRWPESEATLLLGRGEHLGAQAQAAGPGGEARLSGAGTKWRLAVRRPGGAR